MEKVKPVTHFPIEQALNAITGAAIQGYRRGQENPSLGALIGAGIREIVKPDSTDAPASDPLVPDDKLAETIRNLHADFVHEVGHNTSIMLRTTAALTLAARELGDLSDLPALAERDPAAARAKLNLLGRAALTLGTDEDVPCGDDVYTAFEAANALYADLLMSGLIPDDLNPLDLPTEDEAKTILGLTTVATPPPHDDDIPHSNS